MNLEQSRQQNEFKETRTQINIKAVFKVLSHRKEAWIHMSKYSEMNKTTAQ